MTSPVAPAWLDVDQVGSWLSLRGTISETESANLVLAAAAVESHVQRCRPDFWVPVLDDDGEVLGQAYRPDHEVTVAAVMLAARVYRRRNSPAGVEVMGESIAYASRYDPEIDRALRTGFFSSPQVG